MELHIAPDGRDTWSGRLPEPAADGRDGPLATIAGALARLNVLTRGPRTPIAPPETHVAAIDGPVTLTLRGGRYQLERPVRFGPQHAWPLCIRSAPGERAILDGGRRIEGWREADANGHRAWVAAVPGLGDGAWPIKQLWVNGRRAPVARFPKRGFFTVEDPLAERYGWGHPGSDRFIAAAGDIDPAWRNLDHCEVLLFHYWIEERMPIADYDPDTRVVTSTRTSRVPLTLAWDGGGAPYVVENVFEALQEPGECWFDRVAGEIWYLPREGERLDAIEAYAPVLDQLLVVDGDHAAGRHVSWLRLQDLTFRHAEAAWPGDPDAPGACLHEHDHRGTRGLHSAAIAQGACDVPGALYLRGARHCSIEDCTIEHVGWYGIELADGCDNCRLVGNEIHDTGAGGIRIGGSDAQGPVSGRTGRNRISDNHCHDGGHYFTCGIGILATHTFGNLITHNHIHDYFYSAISVGWMWGYHESVTRDNEIAWNHCHDLGKGVLSDMGGIYTLGPQPGTRIHHNLIHDVACAKYGGWAIYPDEGSGHLVIEDNVCYDTSSSVFHQHYGRENTIRNNIFAFGREGCVALSRHEPHLSATFHTNIVVGRGQSIYTSGYGWDAASDPSPLLCFGNCLFDYDGGDLAAAEKADTTAATADGMTFAQWRERGRDRFSRWVDPGFADPAARDFTLGDDSPALELGFRPIDLTGVGPRPHDRRG